MNADLAAYHWRPAVVLACLALLIRGHAWPGTSVLFRRRYRFTGDRCVGPAEALQRGFANEGLMTIAMFCVVVAGIRETGGTEWLAHYLLGRPKTLQAAQCRLMLPVMLMSGFMDNTPLVAAFIPAILTWARRLRLSLPSC
ncbi:MAG: SLC13 family permease [Candidatus Competibacteraceae bacterium]